MRWFFIVVISLFTEPIFGQNINYVDFEGNIVSATYSVRLDEAFFDDSISQNGDSTIVALMSNADSLSDVERVIFDIEREKRKDRVEQYSIRFANKLRFNYEGKVAVIVCYDLLMGTTVLEKASAFLTWDDRWKTNLTSTVAELTTVVRLLKSNAFWAFYSRRASDYPEIDLVKARFKTTDGILDMLKLGAYLKNRPKEMVKYCDF